MYKNPKLSIKEILTYVSARRIVLWSLALLGVIAAEVLLTAAIPSVRGHFIDTLNAKVRPEILTGLYYFIGILGLLGAVQGIKTYISGSLALVLREGGTGAMMSRWSKVPNKEAIQNYTQAQTQALHSATNIFLETGMEIVISSAIVLALIVANIDKPVVLYSSAGFAIVLIGITMLFRRPLVDADKRTQSSESGFREALFKMARTELTLEDTAKEFSGVQKNLNYYLKVTLGFTFFSRVKGALSTFIPYILLLTPFLEGQIKLGEYMGGVSTFELIVVNAAIITILYPKWTQARASVELINEFVAEVHSKTEK